MRCLSAKEKVPCKQPLVASEESSESHRRAERASFDVGPLKTAIVRAYYLKEAFQLF